VASPDPPAPRSRQQVYRRTLEATREAITEVRENMRAVREARDRTQKRVEELQKELAKTRQLAMTRAAREERLERALKRLRTDRFRCASELAHVTEVNKNLDQQLQELTLRCNSLAEKATDLQLVVKQKADLQRRLSEARSVGAAKDRMIADLEKHLRQARAVAEKARKSEEKLAAHEKERTTTLQTQASELVKENTELKAAFKVLQETADELRSQFNAERELRETLQFDLDLSRKTIRELKNTVGDVIDSGHSALTEFEEALGSS
jgi:chromosome segregation ATPase